MQMAVLAPGLKVVELNQLDSDYYAQVTSSRMLDSQPAYDKYAYLDTREGILMSGFYAGQ